MYIFMSGVRYSDAGLEGNYSQNVACWCWVISDLKSISIIMIISCSCDVWLLTWGIATIMASRWWLRGAPCFQMLEDKRRVSRLDVNYQCLRYAKLCGIFNAFSGFNLDFMFGSSR
jgi:hypothetical protein